MVMLKMNNLRFRTEKDSTAPLSSESIALKYFTGKGRKKALEADKKVERIGTNPTLSAMLYHEKKKE